MKVTIDQDNCTLCGLCADVSPDIFEMGDDTAIVKADPIPADAESTIQDAVDSCATGAILVA